MKGVFSAYLFMDEGCDPREHHAYVDNGSSRTVMVGVSDLEQAGKTARMLAADGVQAIELCGAFGPEGAHEIIRATAGRVAVGYATHFPSEDEKFSTVFGEPQTPALATK